jgi:hypothetical protein
LSRKRDLSRMYFLTVSSERWRDWRMMESSGTLLRKAWVQKPALKEWPA